MDLYNIQHKNDINQLVENAIEYGWIHSNISKNYQKISNYIIFLGIFINSISCFLSVGSKQIPSMQNIPNISLWIIATNIISSFFQLVPNIFQIKQHRVNHLELSEKFTDLVVQLKTTGHQNTDYIDAYNKHISYLIKQSNNITKFKQQTMQIHVTI